MWRKAGAFPTTILWTNALTINNPESFVGDDFFQELLMSITAYDQNISIYIFRAACFMCQTAAAIAALLFK